jgi:hypothetical protein
MRSRVNIKILVLVFTTPPAPVRVPRLSDKGDGNEEGPDLFTDIVEFTKNK